MDLEVWDPLIKCANFSKMYIPVHRATAIVSPLHNWQFHVEKIHCTIFILFQPHAISSLLSTKDIATQNL